MEGRDQEAISGMAFGEWEGVEGLMLRQDALTKTLALGPGADKPGQTSSPLWDVWDVWKQVAHVDCKRARVLTVGRRCLLPGRHDRPEESRR